MYSTNAECNRQQAIRLFKAGFTPQEIAKHYNLVWALSDDGRLTQIYNEQATIALHRSDKIARECNLLETNIRMTKDSVDKLIKGKKVTK